MKLGSLEILIVFGFGFFLILILIASLVSAFSTGDSNVSVNQSNKVTKVNLIGGIIGLFMGSPAKAINRRCNEENAKGWEVVQVLPDTSFSMLAILGRIVLLLLTLFLFTTANGYLMVLKKRG